MFGCFPLVAVLAILAIAECAQPSIYFIVISSVKSVKRRNAVRATWLTWLNKYEGRTGYKFFIDTPTDAEDKQLVKNEMEAFGDLELLETRKGYVLLETNLRTWESLEVSYGKHGEKYDYYAMVHDDSFVCVQHFFHDASFWPGTFVYVSHLRAGAADVIHIVGSKFAERGIAETKRDPKMRDLIFDRMSERINATTINDVTLFYGAFGIKNKHNDWKNGWVGIPLMTPAEKINFCNVALAAHQSYPEEMLDLWVHVHRSKNHNNFPKPLLSTDIMTLDKTVGYGD